jgi:TadE-like protein
MLDNYRKKHKGASMTEFVIIGPVAILLTFVILQSGLLYMAKLQLNNAVFMAARAGATDNAKTGFTDAMKSTLVKGLIPFYQNSFETNDVTRLAAAAAKAAVEYGPMVRFQLISPSTEAFQVYGIQKAGITYIPNDNLEFRTPTPVAGSTISIRDANVLRIKVTYAYELKVPLMQAIVKRIMCPFTPGSDVTAWDRFDLLPLGPAANSDCAYYAIGRFPIVSYATVQMQSPPQR